MSYAKCILSCFLLPMFQSVFYVLLCSVHTMEQWKVHGQKGTGKVLASKTFFRGITEAVHKPAVALDFGPSVLCPGYLALVTDSGRKEASFSVHVYSHDMTMDSKFW